MVRWADHEKVAGAVRAYASRLRRTHPELTGVHWYGSWVTGVPTPSSDVDLCGVVTADARRPRDRVPDYLPGRFPVGVDLVVLTEDEMKELPRRSPSWYRAITSGVEV